MSPAKTTQTGLDLAGQFSHTYLGLAALSDPRFIDQQLVGGAADVWGGLAQQPSCLSGLGAARPEAVRNRPQLVRHLDSGAAWTCDPHPSSQAARSYKRRRAARGSRSRDGLAFARFRAIS